MQNVCQKPKIKLNRKTILTKRAEIIQAIRQYFWKNGFLEVETPIRVATPAMEDYIEAEPSGEFYLRTSPELHMKRLLSEKFNKIFQIGSCFRMDEKGTRHRPEFTMLEWYRTNSDYKQILDDTIKLIQEIAQQTLNTQQITYQDYNITLNQPWQTITVKDAFAKYANCTLKHAINNDIFEETLVEQVEPNLGFSTPTILIDYPATIAGLAKLDPNNPQIAQRWELYICGLELANAYSELLDPEEQLARFTQCKKLRIRENRPIYPIDQKFITALKTNIPPSGGIALGIDRLIMILLNITNIIDTMTFIE